MKLGERIIWRGRAYFVRGWDPRGLPERSADLEDEQTGVIVQVPLCELDLDSVCGPPAESP